MPEPLKHPLIKLAVAIVASASVLFAGYFTILSRADAQTIMRVDARVAPVEAKIDSHIKAESALNAAMRDDVKEMRADLKKLLQRGP